MPLIRLLLLRLLVQTSAEWKPLSTDNAWDLFPTVNRTGSAAPGMAFGGRRGPLPTNAWWENLATASDSASAEGNIFQMPYIVLAGGRSVHAMQPSAVEAASQSFDKAHALSLGSIEELSGPLIDAWDELSLSLAWTAYVSRELQAMTVPLVRGSPYITAEYTSTTPQISSEQGLVQTGDVAFILVDGKAQVCDETTLYTGMVFAFDFKESGATWLIFAPENSTWVCYHEPFSLVAVTPLNGAVRVALASRGSGKTASNEAASGSPETIANNPETSAYVKLLVEHAGNYPASSQVNFAVKGDVGTVTWDWEVRQLTGWRSEQLLQLAWPVHLPLFSTEVRHAAEDHPATPFRDLRGPATAVVGNRWELHYELFPDVSLSAPRPIAKTYREDLLQALRGDQGAMWSGQLPDSDFDLPLQYQVGLGDTYFSGKMLARLGRLISIADDLGESKEPYFDRMVNRLTRRLEVWLKDDTPAPLIYDTSWGGLIHCGCIYEDCDGRCTPHCKNDKSLEGCPALLDVGMNFGNTVYNDHHFHYGYFVYAAAVLAKYNPEWERRWRPKILAIARDYGNPSATDSSFPVARHKDWFLGFSWAGGIHAATPNGRNQESTSEAINSYYALYAYGAVVDAPFASELKDVGRLFIAMESHGADTYWHVRSNSPIYGDDFPHKVVGILWEHAATYQTWFGTNPYLVGGIQLLPFTPVMEHYLKMDWTSEHFATFKEECDQDANCGPDGWSWTVCLEQAVLHPDKARECLARLPQDAFSVNNSAACGNSLTNSLHWIATRPELVLPDPVDTTAHTSSKVIVKREDPHQVAPAIHSAPEGMYAHEELPRCTVGEQVLCPNSTAYCAGGQCCADGSTCPSAPVEFLGCWSGKKVDCTRTFPVAWVAKPPPTRMSNDIQEALADNVLRRFTPARVHHGSPPRRGHLAVLSWALPAVAFLPATAALGLQWRAAALRRENQGRVPQLLPPHSDSDLA